MIIEKQIVVRAAPETIFRIYEDVENWNTWDPDTRAARLDRGLALGSKGYLSPSKGHSIPISVTACKANHHFRVTSKTRLFRIDFDHELTPTVSGTRVVHRVSVGGLMKPVLALMLVPRIDEGLPETLRTLKTRAERDASRKA